jgi:nicotinate phosphoribosyltransferase
VKILATGGFTLERIRQYVEEGVPVDAFGIGSALFAGRHGFTADVVRLDGQPLARVGNQYRPNAKMEKVK